MLRTAITLTLWLTISGCNSQHALSERVDISVFAWMGRTVLTHPPKVALKDIHLDSGVLLGSDVIVTGELVAMGDYYSHLIMADDTGRMLVVLTGMRDPESRLADRDLANIAVLGMVERGKKGLPYIRAKSIYLLKP